jgi:hypothetical protein
MITLFIVIRQLENTYEVSFKRDRIEHFLKSSKDLRIMVKDTHVDHGLISASLLASLHAMHELQRAGSLNEKDAAVIADFKSLTESETSGITFNANFTVVAGQQNVQRAIKSLPITRLN